MANPTRISELSAASGGPLASDQVPIARGAGSSGQTYKVFASQFLTSLLSAADTSTIDLNFNATGDVGVLTANTKDGMLISDTPPPSPLNGQLWFDSSSGVTSVYYDSTWVDVGGGDSGTSAGSVNGIVQCDGAGNFSAAVDGTDYLTSTTLPAAKGSVKAWVNFNGGSTPITVHTSYNVSSITDNGAGDYILNFPASVFADNRYVLFGTVGSNAGNASSQFCIAAPGPYSTSPGLYATPKLQTTTQVEIYTAGSDGVPIDIGMVHISLIGN